MSARTAPSGHVAYLGLGSNLGDSKGTIARAVTALNQLPESRIVACSHYYHSPPWGVTDQPDFTNAVVALETGLNPFALLQHGQQMEKNLGRRRSRHWGERVIDIDILLYGDHWLNTPELTFPHRWLAERAFVLLPLLEIAGDLSVPGVGAVTDLWHALQTKSPQTIAKGEKIVW